MGKKYFTMSFDDGLEQDKKLLKLMKTYSLKGTFNLNGGLFGEKNRVARIGDIGFMEMPEQAIIRRKLFKNCDHHRIPEDEIKQVYEGVEVASHAFKHEAIARLSEQKVNESLNKDIEVLSRIMGYQIRGHAYPGGFSSDTAEKCLQENQLIYGREAFTDNLYTFPNNPLRFKPTCSHKSKNLFDLFDKFLGAETEDDLLFVMWGHSYEFDYGTQYCSWDRIETFFKHASGHQELTYCTNKEAFESYML